MGKNSSQVIRRPSKKKLNYFGTASVCVSINAARSENIFCSLHSQMLSIQPIYPVIWRHSNNLPGFVRRIMQVLCLHSFRHSVQLRFAADPRTKLYHGKHLPDNILGQKKKRGAHINTQYTLRNNSTNRRVLQAQNEHTHTAQTTWRD